MALHLETPVIESSGLSLLTGRSVLLKLDALQPCGSFKLRGIGHACEVYFSRGARKFVSSSGGNAGLAVAYVARKLGVQATVVVPKTTTATAIDLLKQDNADVIVHGDSWQEANALAQTMIGPNDAFIHPFDDPLLWEGHASLVDEVVRAKLAFDAVILCVGGGGLLAGVAEGLTRNGLDNIPIVAVETEGAASLRASMDAGRLVALDAIKSVATSLGAKQVAQKAFELSQSGRVKSIVVSDRQALNACERFMTDHRLVVEPACGASLAPLYENHSALTPYQRPLVVVCGGATANVDQIRAWLRASAP